MADNLPDNTPAPNDGASGAPAPQGASGATGAAPSSVPGAAAADGTPAPQAPLIDFNSFNEDQKKYLAGQGITSQEQLTGEAITKVINHARSSQQTARERQDELDKVRGVVAPQPQAANPFAPGASQTPSTTPPNPDPNTPPAPQQGGLDSLGAFTLANQLVGLYPELATELSDGTFYQGMQDIGIPLTLPNGQVNINGITAYGKQQQTQKQLEAKLEAANKPNENNIPEANPAAPLQPAEDAPMTKQMAQAIALHVSQGNSHPRQVEATAFLQKNVG